MIILKNYTIKRKKDYYVATPNEPIICECGGVPAAHGSKKRTLITNDGKKQIFSLKRVYCAECNKLHIVMPDVFLPYKHYEKKAIEGVKQGVNDCCAADDSTLYRWKNPKTPTLH